MGQKINPNAPRLGFIKPWNSMWFSLKDMPALLGEDHRIRQMVTDRFRSASVSKVTIERAGDHLRVAIHTARPGIVIGKKGADIEAMKASVEKMTGRKTYVDVREIKEPELDAHLVAQAICFQLEKRIGHRRAMKRAMERTLQAGALGIKVMAGGRLGGAEIARREWMREGRVPLHTFSADIDYGLAEAHTTMGKIGVKVWIFKKLLNRRSHNELLTAARAVQAQEAEKAAAEQAAAPAAEAAPAETPYEEPADDIRSLAAEEGQE